jgi:hypothetical protein
MALNSPETGLGPTAESSFLDSARRRNPVFWTGPDGGIQFSGLVPGLYLRFFGTRPATFVSALLKKNEKIYGRL